MRRPIYYRIRLGVRVLFWLGVAGLFWFISARLWYTPAGYCIGDLISCSRHEDITTTKLIDKLITKYIEDNNYDIEKIFNDNLEVKQDVLTSLIDYNFSTQDQIEYK